MAVTQYVKPITAKLMPLDANKIKIQLRQANLRVCNRAAEELRFLVEPWNHKPEPVVKMEMSSNEIKGSVQVEDTAMFMLDDGTSIRWALMSDPFIPKTSANRLRSGHGVGKAVIRGQRAMEKAGRGPQPGIKPRNFSNTLMKVYGPMFAKEVDKVMADAIQKGQAVKI